MELKRMYCFEVGDGLIISQFHLESNHRYNMVRKVTSKDGRELKYQYTDLSGYITVYGEDVEEIIVTL